MFVNEYPVFTFVAIVFAIVGLTLSTVGYFGRLRKRKFRDDDDSFYQNTNQSVFPHEDAQGLEIAYSRSQRRTQYFSRPIPPTPPNSDVDMEFLPPYPRNSDLGLPKYEATTNRDQVVALARRCSV